MTPPTVWLSFDESPASGRWDQTWLTQLIPAGDDRTGGWADPSGDATVVVTGGVDADQLAVVLDQLDQVLLIVASNEEGLFPWRRFVADNRVLWLHTPHPDDLPVGYRHVRYLPTGWTPLPRLADSCPTKAIPWVFAGQVTHGRRRALVHQLEQRSDGALIQTESFASGLARDEYADLLRVAHTAPCPAGNTSIDTFRVYEALEAGAVPILDSKNSQGTVNGSRFWSTLFGIAHPLPVVSHWKDVQGLIDKFSNPDKTMWNAQIAAWWTRYKAGWRSAYRADWAALDAPVAATVDDDITVIVTASPIPSHPDTDLLDATIRSIRDAGLNAEIVVCFDGVRVAQGSRSADYFEHIRRVMWAANHRWDRVSVSISNAHLHQANLTRDALAETTTPLVLFVEHDTPLIGQIDWDVCGVAVRSGEVNSIRFHYSDTIHPDHQHMLESPKVVDVHGCPLLRTHQWSQRPHLASTAWYRDVLNTWFPPDCNTMIEDRVHGPAANAPWRDWRLAIYAPPGGYLRSTHLDGRGGDVKYAMNW